MSDSTRRRFDRETADLGCNSAGARFVPVGDRNSPSARGCKAPAQGGANAATATGHYDDLVTDFHCSEIVEQV
jgi:hypothetical protein